ncbi:outer membrane beta-barrel protein [Fangia hongkongensis]|uniref:outer membrane beta-barrel protein n=2 Tax=Fangia hongkongensis TaxID=270495 RepID=UPI0003685F3E|nr:outer membrane beta-barrel protein [Fangia hongkongensis]
MYIRKVALASLLLASGSVFADNNISLPSTNFNFDIQTVSAQSTYQPSIAFVNDGKTYIKFPPTVTKDNLPIILVDQLPNHSAPIISYQGSYVVVNQPATQVKIFNPKTRKLLYQLRLQNHFNYGDVKPSPYILPYEFQGLFMGINLGMATIDSKGYKPAAGMKLGYDWSLSKKYGFMAGFELGANYDGQKTTDSQTVKSWNMNLMFRAKYQFQSGFNLVAKAGPAYVWNSDQANDSIDNSIAARAGVQAGYLFANGIGLSLEYDHLFSNSKVNSVNSFSGGVSYIF